MGEEVAIKKVLVKRVTNCGSCGRWYRMTRIYHVHFFGKEKTMRGMVEKDVDEDRMVCPKCYEDMGYIAGKSVPDNEYDVHVNADEIIVDPNYVQQQEITLPYSHDRSSSPTTADHIQYAVTKLHKGISGALKEI